MEATKDMIQQCSIDPQCDAVPLTMAPPGEDVTLISINSGQGLRCRLYSMGLTPGVRLRILNSGTPGPFLIAVRDFKVAIGYGVARKLLVR